MVFLWECSEETNFPSRDNIDSLRIRLLQNPILAHIEFKTEN
jgi:hypothetical protein